VTERKFLKPVAGISLPLPDGRAWPESGEWVDIDQYVRRRMADGDLVVARPPAAPEAPAPETPKTKGK